MRTSKIVRALAAGALAAGLSVAALPSSVAASAGSIGVTCQTSTFPAFDWDAAVDATAVAKDGQTTLRLQLSKLPGVVPVTLSGLNMVGTVDVSVDGKKSTLTGSGTINITGGQPFDIPAVSGKIAGNAPEIDVTITKLSYDIPAFQMNTLCPAGTATTSLPLQTIKVSGDVASTDPEPTQSPSPSPSETASPSPSETASPSPSETASPSPSETASPSPSETASPDPDEDVNGGDVEGKPAKGQVTFACVLYPAFGADNARFDYKADVTVSGARATADDSEVNLRATFSKLPGIAPVPIVDGGMSIESKGSVAGEAMTFTGSSTVNVDTKEVVPVPTVTATVETDAEEAEVVLDTFKFDFGEMAGLHVYSECEAKNGKVGTMTIGIGELADAGDGDDGNGGGSGGNGGDGGSGSTPSASTTLPKTGGGDAMPVIALWALALGLVGAGALVWLPKRRLEQI